MSSIRDMVKKQSAQEEKKAEPTVQGTFRGHERKALMVRIPDSVHQNLKIKAATEGTTINDLVLNAITSQYPEISS
jgi:predicted HicB family RNase H-like nuclease